MVGLESVCFMSFVAWRLLWKLPSGSTASILGAFWWRHEVVYDLLLLFPLRVIKAYDSQPLVLPSSSSVALDFSQRTCFVVFQFDVDVV